MRTGWNLYRIPNLMQGPCVMLELLKTLLATATSALKPRRDLALENLALRQQLAILKRKRQRPKLTAGDRLFWVTLSGVWKQWSDALIIVIPARP